MSDARDDSAEQDSPEEPRLIIDEDWKEQVAREREEQRKQRTAQPAPDADAAAGAESKPAEQPGEAEMPPASFEFLISTLAAQTLAALGMAAGPDGKPLPAQPALARHMIDTLAMLEQKTSGNLNAEESTMLQSVLHELRMAFLSTQR